MPNLPAPCLIVAVAAALLLPAGPAAAQSAAARDAAVDSIFAPWNRTDSPGCAVGVYRDDRIVYARGYGMADLERRVPITPATVFDIGSTSKQFTAAALVLLAQQGRLTLDDDVRRYVPELPDHGAPITIRQLLNHTSGLRDYIGLLTLGGARIDDVTTVEDALSVIVRQRALNFAPGSEYLYSNSGFFLASVIVERVSGMTLRDFAAAHLFGPLGMTRTHYLGSYDDIVADRAQAYAPRPGGGYGLSVSRWLQTGDGAVFTTVEELLAWDRNFYAPRVGGADLNVRLHERGRLTNGDSIPYALGLIHGTYRGRRTVSHGGSWGGYRAELLRFPEHHFSVAVLCNLGSIDPSRLAQRVADAHLADVLAPPAATARTARSAVRPVDVPAAALRGWTGIYRQPATGALRAVDLEEGVLVVTAGPRLRLRPFARDRFDVVDAPVAVEVRFEAAAGDRARRLHWLAEGQPPQVFEAIRVATPSPRELEAYAGAFTSEELEATYRLRVDGDALVLRRRGAPEARLQPLETDVFQAGGMTLRFERDAAGTVTGFRLDIGRVRGLAFERAVSS
jgi:CubicO group peptidase (beta-lactamase class C family)